MADITLWERIAALMVTGGFLYLAVGVIFALAYSFFGVKGLDPGALKGTWGFRLLLLPGATAFWPLLARRWLRHEGPPIETNAHRRVAEDADAREPTS